MVAGDVASKNMLHTKFWLIPSEYHGSVAMIDAAAGREWSYRELDEAVETLAQSVFLREKQLVFVFCHNRPVDIVAYLASLRAGHTVLLLESKLNSPMRQRLIDTYTPDLLVDAADAEVSVGYAPCYRGSELCISEREGAPPSHCLFPELGVLLSTSGTTGSPKLVRLSYGNVAANAVSIAEYLLIGAGDRAITSLPMSYSYGLSVINSHLLRGASLVCTNETTAQRQFWDYFRKYACTSFAGVPYNYQILMRFGFKTMELPSLKTMTQAGGRLGEEIKKYFLQVATERGVRFYVMYGQTEATARISYVPPERLGEKLSSIGIPLPGGSLSIRRDDGSVTTPRVEGELVYEGPNVMLGYAESLGCLAKGDECRGVLHTGDVAYRDEDGFYYISGRLKRFLKVFGLRLNLDEIERTLEDLCSCTVACSGVDDKLVILIEQAHAEQANALRQAIVDSYKIHLSAVKVRTVASMPHTSTGKKDYTKIKELGLE